MVKSKKNWINHERNHIVLEQSK